MPSPDRPELTGETLTDAVISPLEVRLASERRKRGSSANGTAKRMLAFADKFAPGMDAPSHSSGHAEIYGDDGLPK